MKEVRIFCENTQSHLDVALGYTLKELAERISPKDGAEHSVPILAALVDNKLKALDYKIINPHNIRFIGYDHPDGRRTYIRDSDESDDERSTRSKQHTGRNGSAAQPSRSFQ